MALRSMDGVYATNEGVYGGVTCDDEGDGDREHANQNPDPNGDAVQLAVLDLQHPTGRLRRGSLVGLHTAALPQQQQC